MHWKWYRHNVVQEQVGWGPRLQMAPNDLKIAEKTPKWPHCLQSDFGNHLHQNSAPLAVVLSGHMTSLQQFWVWGHKLARNGPKMAPKWPQNCPKWPQRVKSDLRNHLHQNSGPLAVILSGHMTSLQQFWIWGHKLARNGPKMAPKWPQMTSSLQGDFWNHLHRNSAPLAVILSGHMTSLRQIWVWGQKWPKIAPKWPKMA